MNMEKDETGVSTRYCCMSGEKNGKKGDFRERSERIGGEITQLKTGSVSMRTVDTIHLLRRSQMGDAEDPWSLVRSTRMKHEGA